MEDDLNWFLKREGNLIFWKMEDNLKLWQRENKMQYFDKWKRRKKWQTHPSQVYPSSGARQP